MTQLYLQSRKPPALKDVVKAARKVKRIDDRIRSREADPAGGKGELIDIDEALLTLRTALANAAPKRLKEAPTAEYDPAKEFAANIMNRRPSTAPPVRSPAAPRQSALMKANPPLSPAKTTKLEVMFTGVPSSDRWQSIMSPIKMPDNDSTSLLRAMIRERHDHNKLYLKVTTKSSNVGVRRYKDFIEDGILRDRAKFEAEKEFEDELLKMKERGEEE
jgi:hypothetical protein